MTQNHRFDIWLIVRDGSVVTQYLSQREANQYATLRNQSDARRPFQMVSGTAEVEVVLPATEEDASPAE